MWAPAGVEAFLLEMIPSTYFGDLASGEVLPVLVVAILSGFALVAIGDAGKPIVQFLESFVAMLFAMVAIVMRLAPLGALGAMAFTVGSYRVKALRSLPLPVPSLDVARPVFLFRWP